VLAIHASGLLVRAGVNPEMLQAPQEVTDEFLKGQEAA
jgi:hypothetical protein